MADIVVKFDSAKLERTANWLIRQFASTKSLVIPRTTSEYMELFKTRGLGMQYRDRFERTYFPTQQGWINFLTFIDVVHAARPFRLRAAHNDTFQNFNTAFARMLGDGKLPETTADLIGYLPNSFKEELLGRTERLFCKISGVDVDCGSFVQVGHCLIGRYELISFDQTVDESQASKAELIASINRVYDSGSPVIASAPILGTADHCKRISAFQYDLSLSLICVLLNMTYESAFRILWGIRVVDRPEFGISKQVAFSFTKHRPNQLKYTLGWSARAAEQRLKIDDDQLALWHDYFNLAAINRILCLEDGTSDLSERLINALLYFRQAAYQSTHEMRIATLWICVEAFFTANNKEVIKALLPGLLAMTIRSLPRPLWPKEAQSVPDLRRVFTRYYQYRSATFHHGRREHVTERDVQAFSFVVGNLILGVAQLIAIGYESAEQLLATSKKYIDRL